jgi:hypothetical protein
MLININSSSSLSIIDSNHRSQGFNWKRKHKNLDSLKKWMEQKTRFSWMLEPATVNCAWNLLKILFASLVNVSTLIYFSKTFNENCFKFLIYFLPSCTAKIVFNSIKSWKVLIFPRKKKSERINSNYPFLPLAFRGVMPRKMLIFCGGKSSINNRMKGERKVWNFPIIKTSCWENVWLRLFSSLMN